MDRTILHCDLNCFFASVELLSLPRLRKLPVAVCGDPASRHGIILAKNERAKGFGVKTAETVWQAKKKCPELVLVPPHHQRYREYSKKVNAIYLRFTDLVEPFGIDESWLDVTGSLHLFGGDPVALADHIRDTVRRELGLTLSVGVSFNKVFAKLGSDYRKPDATTRIGRDNWRDLLYPLPVGSLLYVGRAAEEALGQYGIRTIGQLAGVDRGLLLERLGKLGGQLHDYANGHDPSPVRPWHQKEPVKSVGNGTTFPRNLTTLDQVRAGTALLSDSVAMRLRRQGLYCGGVQVTLKDPQFRVISRQKQLARSTHLMREIQAAAMELILSAWKPPSPIRLITVTAIHLTEEGETYCQTDLFADPEGERRQQRQEKLEQAMDAIRGKFGHDAIAFGRPGERKGGGTLP